MTVAVPNSLGDYSMTLAVVVSRNLRANGTRQADVASGDTSMCRVVGPLDIG